MSLTRLAAARHALKTELLSTVQVQVHVLLWVHIVQLRIADHAISDKSAHRRGDQYIDGSLTDFINSSNSRLLHCDGEALILDYFQVACCNAMLFVMLHIICDTVLPHVDVVPCLVFLSFLMILRGSQSTHLSGGEQAIF